MAGGRSIVRCTSDSVKLSCLRRYFAGIAAKGHLRMDTDIRLP